MKIRKYAISRSSDWYSRRGFVRLFEEAPIFFDSRDEAQAQINSLLDLEQVGCVINEMDLSL